MTASPDRARFAHLGGGALPQDDLVDEPFLLRVVELVHPLAAFHDGHAAVWVRNSLDRTGVIVRSWLLR